MSFGGGVRYELLDMLRECLTPAAGLPAENATASGRNGTERITHCHRL